MMESTPDFLDYSIEIQELWGELGFETVAAEAEPDHGVRRAARAAAGDTRRRNHRPRHGVSTQLILTTINPHRNNPHQSNPHHHESSPLSSLGTYLIDHLWVQDAVRAG